MGKIITLASRLAESILMDWDKEDVIKLAKEVAVACKENIEFTSLVKGMRDAQKVYAETFPTGYGCYAPTDIEREVDEYLKKLEGES